MTSELIRVYAAVRSPRFRESLEAALRRPDGYELEWGGAADVSVAGIVPAGCDVLLLELPADPADGPNVIDAALGGAELRPVVVLAPAGAESRALRAVQHGCSDYLMEGTLYPEVIQRSLRYVVDRAREIRRRDQAERALIDSEQRYRSLFEQSRDAIYMTERNGEIMEMNQAALDLLGYQADDLIGRDVRALYADPVDRERFQREIGAQDHVCDFEIRLRRKDGQERWCLMSAWVRRGRDGQVEGYQGILHDITDRKSFEDQLAHEAFHDSLTGLPNRGLFMDRLERAVARRRRGEERDLAVMFLDMDRFKVVNDSLGHLAGDELLRRMGRLLSEEIRDEDTVARIGGDEFAILLDGVADAADPTHVAERIQTRLRDPLRIHDNDVFSSLSIGIALGGGGVDDPESLLRSADAAMYRAKELGPARYQIYDEAMHAHAVTLLQVETDLRLALERNEFVVHYQPLVDLSDDRMIGFEALVRWEHPERGLLLPQAFIPIAEDTGLIVPLGATVLRTAMRQLRQWQLDPAFHDLFVSVNLSARQFSAPDLADAVRTILQEEGVDGTGLRLEITESAMIRSPAEAMDALRTLREQGVTFCIDDFGTGYSSLSTLHELPVDILNIDRSFILRMEEDDGQIVETILALARNLGMQAVAEGVETEEQLARLRALGAASVQGFLFSTPIDGDAATKLLRKTEPA